MVDTVLLTRPEAQSRRFATALHRRFGADPEVVIAPVMRIVVADALPAFHPDDVLVFTSENGVTAYRALGGIGDRAAICVGARTAEVAAAAGLRVQVGPGSAAGLVATVRDAAPPGRVVHLHGRHVTGNLAAALRHDGLSAEAAVIYEQVAQPLSTAVRGLLAGPGPVLLPVFSARTARLLAPDIAAARAEMRIAAISPAVAAALPVQGHAQMQVADRPDSEAMLETLERLRSGGSVLEGTHGGV